MSDYLNLPQDGVPHASTPDARYTVDLEYCGQESPKYVARFCGRWIGWSDTRQGAIEMCHAAYNERMSPNDELAIL